MIYEFLSIGVSNSKQVGEIPPFYFTNNKFEKYKLNKLTTRVSAGIPLKVSVCSQAAITVSLKKYRTNAFALMLFEWKTLRPIKTTLIPTLYSDSNHKIIFKLFEGRNSYLLFYQECISQIEIRRFLSLKKLKSFSLFTICQSLGIESQFQELRVCIDAVYMPNQGAILMCLNHMIVLCEEETRPAVLFKFENPKLKDRFLSVRWNCQQNTLLAETASSIMLFEIGDEGVRGTRVLQHPWLQHCNSRILHWEPSASLVFSAKSTKLTRENIYIFQYSENGMKLVAYVANAFVNSMSYSPQRKQLLYVDEDFSGNREVRTLWPLKLLDENDRLDMADEDKFEKGELLAHLPDFVKIGVSCTAVFIKNVLAVRSLL